MKTLKVLGMTLGILNGANASVDQINFQRACDEGKNITISAVGDILLHETLQRRAIREGSFKALWEEVIPYFEAVDYSYGNLESPAAKGINKNGDKVKDPGFVYDGRVYSSYPRFNYNPRVIRDLKNSGIDILSTANNHSLDRKYKGIDETIKAIEKEDMEFMGTRLKKARKKNKLSDWYRVTEINGLKVTWIGCTFLVNYMENRDGSRVSDKYDQVMYCQTKLGQKRIKSIIEKQKKETDAIIITPHWGKEYKNEPSTRQKEYARKWIEMGATAVLGAHPHVLQPIEKIKREDGSEGVVVYSMGNFVSNQGGREKTECPREKNEQACIDKKIAQRSSAVFFLGLTKDDEGKTFINGIKALPTRGMNQYDIKNVHLGLIEDLGEDMIEEDGSRELNHIKNILPEGNLIFPGDAIVTNSECL